MGLKIKKIYLENWKVYKKQTIEFNLETKHNIWIIQGLNGYGKSSIFEAALWCLYGSEVISPKKLITEKVKSLEEQSSEKQGYFHFASLQQNPELKLSVILTLQNGSNIYTISRQAERVKRGKIFYADVSEASFNVNGKTETDGRERIDLLLPRSCKEFFFFDGEKIQEYSSVTQTEETRKAIESILGIPEIVNLKKDTENVIKKIDEKISQANINNSKLKEIDAKLFPLTHEIATIRDRLQTVLEEYRQGIQILEDVKERASQVAELRSKLQKIQELNNKKESLSKEIKQVNDNIDRILKFASIPMMRKPIREMAEELQTRTITNTRISLSVNQLRDLLKADTCICGNCIGEKESNFISQQLKNIEDSGIITEENSRLESLRINLNRISNYKVESLDQLLLQRDRLEDDLEEAKQVIDVLKMETQGTSEKEADELWRKIGQQEKEVEETDKKIKRLRNEIEDLEHQQDRLRRQKGELLNTNSENSALQKQYELAEGLNKATNELIDWYTKDCQQTIEHHTSQLHKSITNKPEEYDGVVLENGYDLKVKQTNGELASPESLSKGEKEALVFAFVIGLSLASGKAAPIVMDSPFSKLDGIHQKNIVKSLPTIDSQVILLAKDTDLPDSLLQQLNPNIAQLHKIRRLGNLEDASVVEVEE